MLFLTNLTFRYYVYKIPPAILLLFCLTISTVVSATIYTVIVCNEIRDFFVIKNLYQEDMVFYVWFTQIQIIFLNNFSVLKQTIIQLPLKQFRVTIRFVHDPTCVVLFITKRKITNNISYTIQVTKAYNKPWRCLVLFFTLFTILYMTMFHFYY